MPNYRVTYQGHEVEGEASSKQNAVRQAIKELIRAELIKRQPDTDLDNTDGCGFKGVRVEHVPPEDTVLESF